MDLHLSIVHCQLDSAGHLESHLCLCQAVLSPPIFPAECRRPVVNITMDVGLLVNANLLLLAAHCLESPSNILLVENLLEGVGSLVLMMNSLGVFLPDGLLCISILPYCTYVYNLWTYLCCLYLFVHAIHITFRLGFRE
jgi:hypothetical protein